MTCLVTGAAQEDAGSDWFLSGLTRGHPLQDPFPGYSAFFRCRESGVCGKAEKERTRLPPTQGSLPRARIPKSLEKPWKIMGESFF